MPTLGVMGITAPNWLPKTGNKHCFKCGWTWLFWSPGLKVLCGWLSHLLLCQTNGTCTCSQWCSNSGGPVPTFSSNYHSCGRKAAVFRPQDWSWMFGYLRRAQDQQSNMSVVRFGVVKGGGGLVTVDSFIRGFKTRREERFCLQTLRNGVHVSVF